MTCGRYMALWPRWRMALWISSWIVRYFYSWMIFCQLATEGSVEGDHDGDIASITIELLTVIEKLMLFFLPATKCFKYLFTSQNAFQWTHFHFFGIQIIQQEWTLMFYAKFYRSSIWLFDENPLSPWAQSPPQRSPPTTPPAAVRPVPGHPGAAGRRCRPGGGLCRWGWIFFGILDR